MDGVVIAVKKEKKPLTNAQKRSHALHMRDYRAIKKKQRAEEEKEKRKDTHARRAIIAHAVISELKERPALSMRQALINIDAPVSYSNSPRLITETPEWNKLLDEMLPRAELLSTHRGLLKASRIEHIAFADGPKSEADCNAYIADNNVIRDDIFTDDDIRAMLAEKSCTVRRISRENKTRHVYFFAPDNRARKDGLEMAYKLRGDFAADKAAVAFSLVALAQQRDALHAASNTPQLPRAE